MGRYHCSLCDVDLNGFVQSLEHGAAVHHMAKLQEASQKAKENSSGLLTNKQVKIDSFLLVGCLYILFCCDFQEELLLLLQTDEEMDDGETLGAHMSTQLIDF